MRGIFSVVSKSPSCYLRKFKGKRRESFGCQAKPFQNVPSQLIDANCISIQFPIWRSYLKYQSSFKKAVFDVTSIFDLGLFLVCPIEITAYFDRYFLNTLESN